MNIVHILICLRGGGIQNFIISLAQDQVVQGHNVSVFVIEKYDYDYCFHLENILLAKGVDVIRLNKTRSSMISRIKTMFKFRHLLSQMNVDVLNSHGEMSHFYALFATYFTKVQHVYTIHNAPEIWGMGLKILARKPKNLIFCSRSAFEMRTQKGRRMEAIDNGVALNIVKTENVVDLRTELSLKKSDIIIVLVGSLRPQKNYALLKNIVTELQDESIHFCICGGNYGKGYINPNVFDGYPTIHCMGLRSDVSAIENGSDLFLSCAKYEGLPIAVLEAYFNGIPCVLSPIPQHKNIADVEKVWLPKSFDAANFVKTIKYALNQDKKSHKDVYELRKRQIEVYSISTTSRRYIEFYKKCRGIEEVS